MQNNNKGKLVAVKYGSRSLTKSKQMYSTFEEKAAAVLLASKKFQHRLVGGSFVFHSDHKAA